jgi:hypothetical protein
MKADVFVAALDQIGVTPCEYARRLQKPQATVMKWCAGIKSIPREPAILVAMLLAGETTWDTVIGASRRVAAADMRAWRRARNGQHTSD